MPSDRLRCPAIACNVERLGPIYKASPKIMGAFNGAIFGIFLLGMFSRRATRTGVWLGALAGTSASCYTAFFSNLGFVWPASAGVLTTLFVGYLASLCTGGRLRSGEALTVRQVLQDG